MRKVSALLALLLLALCVFPGMSLAEALPTSTESLDFSLPASISWDIPEDVLLKTLPEMGSYSSSELDYHMFSIQFAGSPAVLFAAYSSGIPILMGILSYETENTSSVLGQYIAELSETYGDPNSENYDLYKDLVLASEGQELQNPDLYDAAEKSLWEFPDGKTVLIALDFQGVGAVAFNRSALLP